MVMVQHHQLGTHDPPAAWPAQRISRSADQRISGPADQQTSGSADQRASGSADQPFSGSAVQRISGPADQPSLGSGSPNELISFQLIELLWCCAPNFYQGFHLPHSLSAKPLSSSWSVPFSTSNNTVVMLLWQLFSWNAHATRLAVS